MFEIIYIATNLLLSYTVRTYMQSFFKRKAASKCIEIISFLCYAAVITGIYFACPIPAVLIGANISIFFLLTINYSTNIKTRIAATLIIYATLMAIESIIVLFSNRYVFSLFSHGKYNSELGLIIIRVLSLFLVHAIGKFTKMGRENQLPLSYWLSVVCIPTASLLILVNYLNFSNVTMYQGLLVAIAVLLVNFSVIYLYDALAEGAQIKLEKALLEHQNLYYSNQFDIMKSSIAAINSLKHDYLHHFASIFLLIKERNYKEAEKHIAEALKICNESGSFANSGNVSIDSILNFKLGEAKKYNIIIELSLCVPQDLYIPSFDMASLLGNLIDNAVEANAKVDVERFIILSIKYTKGRLIIDCKNPYRTILVDASGNVRTTKRHEHEHGIGLISCNQIVSKYDGVMSLAHENGVFTATALLYI